MSDNAICAVCQKTADHKCGGCHSVYYCGKEHQKAAWKTHKKFCRPFKICTDAILGRHLKSTRDIKAGEVILQEAPLIWGPAQLTVPVCLGCGKAVSDKNSKPCSKCGWPMCSEICEKAPAHLPECRYTILRGDKKKLTITFMTIFKRNFLKYLKESHQKYIQGGNKKFWRYTPLLPVHNSSAMFIQKAVSAGSLEKIDALQSHCEERKTTQKYEQERTGIAQFILRFFKLDNTFTEDDIMRVCGTVMINSHEVPLTEPHHIAIYENTSMFENNCSANCAKSFTNEGSILITSGRHIKKGENLSICYTDPLWGTPSRRHHLYESKFFWCTCARCSDPTEFGTYFSALRCQNSNCKGYLLPKTFLDNSSNEKGADWNCNKCSSSLSSYSVFDLLERIGKDLAEMPKDISRECIKFVETYEQLLHTNHYYLTDVRIALSQLIGQEEEGGLPAILNEDLELKARICQNLANLMKNLIPGEKRIRGLLLFELHASIAEMGRRKPDPELLHGALLESRRILTEAVDLLKHEPDTLPEGKIHKQALANLKELDIVLRTVHKTIGDSP